jgi:hypothetical protein
VLTDMQVAPRCACAMSPCFCLLSQTAQRNDLLFAVTNTTTFPGYGYFLEQVLERICRTPALALCSHVTQKKKKLIHFDPPPPPSILSPSRFLKGFTSWPEDWNTSQENGGYLSKMHGCYNGIGLWFIEGLAGIVVDASQDPPLTFRAAIEAGDIAWAAGSRCVCVRPDGYG